MLFVLTGSVQTGKTRWLKALVEELEARGVFACGVIAPGDWRARTTADGAQSFEKFGIFNELLPDHETIPFARRADLIAPEEGAIKCTQAQSAKLSWAIDDNAIELVNGHLDRIGRATANPAPDSPESIGKPGLGADGSEKALLVIDELGRLELLHGSGLTSALSLADRGATPLLPHALVVVRDQLLQAALERFADAPWGGIQAIFPNADGRAAVFEAVLHS